MIEDYKYCEVTICKETAKTTYIYHLKDGSTITQLHNVKR